MGESLYPFSSVTYSPKKLRGRSEYNKKESQPGRNLNPEVPESKAGMILLGKCPKALIRQDTVWAQIGLEVLKTRKPPDTVTK